MWMAGGKYCPGEREQQVGRHRGNSSICMAKGRQRGQ